MSTEAKNNGAKHTPGPGLFIAKNGSYFATGENAIKDFDAGNYIEVPLSLASAAPELLLACKQVSAWFKSHDGTGEAFGIGMPCQWLDAAIAKAEGK
jgi:hypothetical protein